MGKMKKSKTPTLNMVREQAESAALKGRCVTIKGAWLLALLDGTEGLAMLASKTPQFFNPLSVFEAEEFRDYVLRQREMRKNYGGTAPCAADAGK